MPQWQLPKPVLPFCRAGMRSAAMRALSQAGRMPLPRDPRARVQGRIRTASVVRRIVTGGKTAVEVADATHDVAVGAAGISMAASLLAHRPELDIVIVEPADIHDHEPTTHRRLSVIAKQQAHVLVTT